VYLIECYLKDGRFSHTVNNYCFETMKDAEAWIAEHVSSHDRVRFNYDIVSAMIWRA